MQAVSQYQYDVDAVAACLLQGGVVVIPTDTVYGIAALPSHQGAVDRLYLLKHRPRTKPLPVMVAASADLVSMGVELSPSAMRLLDSVYVPGPLTLAFGFVDGPRVAWLAGREEVAVRIPNDERLLAVIRKTGPLFVTSANAHGVATGEALTQVLPQLEGIPDLAIDGGILGTVASTLVNCRKDPPVIEREGVVSRAEIMALVDSV